MVTVYTDQNLISVYRAKHILDEAGINSVITNEHISFLAGEIPAIACWPRLDILNENDFANAKAALEALNGEIPAGENWECSCGKSHGPQFDCCWNCGASKAE